MSAPIRKKRVFKKYTYRGVELSDLQQMDLKQLTELIHARARRKLSRGLSRKHMSFLARCEKVKQGLQVGEKPKAVKTHLRNMIILPQMVGNIVGVYNGKEFISVDIKADMIGHYLGEFSITYKKVTHGKAGIGATRSSRFIPLK
ncbi:40S ribosomal protein S15 [Anaeramoeba ignava]|uniref:40S ribosomal protein S15 n=1 Tax=Anaeramoeba ignava TaxID=1746090 RepID=A0A9Q0LN61_ANAIG|nr:40S ribosomal protein S15 [Anaeramoeba ignava]|eukprot:Anaeramoba_ignava/a227999_170.p1 GENE.a227999_170~~a227999_170.p1  ORF type:complete len:145 (+),score=38.69 a227999_170:27-461(+)